VYTGGEDEESRGRTYSTPCFIVPGYVRSVTTWASIAANDEAGVDSNPGTGRGFRRGEPRPLLLAQRGGRYRVSEVMSQG